MKIIKEEKNGPCSLGTKELDISKFPYLNKLSFKILENLGKKINYPKQLARELKIHEQNVYYYIKKLEKSGLIEVQKQEKIQGIVANFYGLVSDSFFFKLKEFEEGIKLNAQEPEFLRPFIKNGKLNALIVIGSPDPHGENMARSRDSYLFMDLAIFIGTFLNESPNQAVKLDIEVSNSELKNNNLILIGGPVVNKIVLDINKQLPVFIDGEKRVTKSKITKREYPQENIGVINKIKNPYNKDKQMLVIAGNRYSGTRAAILAIKNNLNELNNNKKSSRVIEGIDKDNNGIVDHVRFLE